MPVPSELIRLCWLKVRFGLRYYFVFAGLDFDPDKLVVALIQLLPGEQKRSHR